MSIDNRVGVWVENGEVYRKEEKQHSPKIYVPLSPDLLEKVVEKARILHNVATMDAWTPSVEASLDETLKELKSLIRTN